MSLTRYFLLITLPILAFTLPRRPRTSPTCNGAPPSPSMSAASSDSVFDDAGAGTMRSCWYPSFGEVFLGSASDVPLPSGAENNVYAGHERRSIRRITPSIPLTSPFQMQSEALEDELEG